MLLLICLLLYLLHNITVFWYFSFLFLRTYRNRRRFYVIFIVNCISLLFLLKFQIHEAVVMVAYCGMIGIELKLIFKESWINIIFGSVCFSLNFFCIKILYTVLYSICKNITITQVMYSHEAMTVIIILTLMTNIPYTIAFKKYFPQNDLNAILSDKGNMKFVSAIVGVIYMYLILNTGNLYIKEDYGFMKVFQLKIAVCSFLGFCASFVYAVLFARLRMYALKSQKIEKELENERRALVSLENEAFHDGLTGCYIREFAEKKIDKLLSEKASFSLIFMDIDGLKLVDDTYGHDEGDFYIKAVANILMQEAYSGLLARMGGDEFLIILENLDSFAVMKSAVHSFDRIKALSQLYDKPYQTSISYGILNVTSDNILSRKELIELADRRMYHFKKSRQKNRI